MLNNLFSDTLLINDFLPFFIPNAFSLTLKESKCR